MSRFWYTPKKPKQTLWTPAYNAVMLTLVHLFLPAVYSLIFLLTLRSPTHFIEFVGGVYLGFGLLFLDRLLHIFLIEPESQFSQSLHQALKKKQILRIARAILTANTMQKQLITRSALFLVAYVALALYIITSTGSAIGIGMILGIGLHYCFDFLLYKRDLELLRSHFLWQLKREFAQQEVNALFLVICVFFLLLTLLAFTTI